MTNGADFLRMRVRPWGLLTAAGVVACCATVAGFLGRFFWAFDLFTHFRVQYAGGLLFLCIVLLAGRRRIPALIFLAFSVINIVIVAPICFGRRPVPPEATLSIRLMLINVNTRSGNPRLVESAVAGTDPDVLVLEEISEHWMESLTWLTNSYPHSCVRPRYDNFGIGLFSKMPIVTNRIDFIGNPEVPTILAIVDAGTTRLQVIATHPVPPVGFLGATWRNGQLNELPDHRRSDMPVIVIGDLNVTPWNYHFKRLLRRGRLLDSARGYGLQTTWPSHNPLMRIPLDHCLHSPDLFVADRRIGPPVGSDHYPLIVDLKTVPRMD